MQENNFEKQVHEKIDGLKISPSDEVWKKLSVIIAKRQGDRRILIFMFLLLLFISSAVIMIANLASGKKAREVISAGNAPHKKSLQERINDSGARGKADAANTAAIVNEDPAGDQMKIIKDIPSTKNTAVHQQPSAIHAPKKIITSTALVEPGHNPNKVIGTEPVNSEVTGNDDKTNFKTGQKPGRPFIIGLPAVPADKVPGPEVKGNSSVEDITPAVNDVAIKGQEKDTAALIHTIVEQGDISSTKSNPLKQDKHWKFGFSFSAGLTATQNGLLGIIGSGSSSESKSSADMSQSTGNNTGSYVSHVPSEIKGGPGLVLGVFLERNISPKTQLLFGVKFRSYNSVMMIGSRVDSLYNFSRNEFYYRSGTETKYRNHFHFIELPVAFRFKLGKQNKIPVYLNTGISVSRLIGSNALQFDTLRGMYYTDNSLLNKTLVNISAGILFSLSGHAKNPVLIGPDINFSLNNMANSGLYQDRHYSYFGILVQKGIGKK